MQQFRFITYNIRKGGGKITETMRKTCMQQANNYIAPIHDQLAESAADFICCQASAIAEHLEFDSAYVANAHSKHGDHGNASFSRLPFIHTQNHNITTNPIEKRGILHNIVKLADDRFLHLFNAHFGLNQVQRNKQVKRLQQIIQNFVPQNDAIIVAGDFNDWNNKIDKQLNGFAGLKSATADLAYSQRLTWPSECPFFSLDRIYSRGLELINIKMNNEKEWKNLSDHLPIQADYRLH